MKVHAFALTASLLALTGCTSPDDDVPRNFGKAYSRGHDGELVSPPRSVNLENSSNASGRCPDPDYIKFNLDDEVGRKLAWNTSKRTAAQGCSYNPY